MKALIASIFMVFSFAVSAADIPQDVEGTEQLNSDECISTATDNCINDVCLTSDSIDCEDNCKKMAQDKCQQQNN